MLAPLSSALSAIGYRRDVAPRWAGLRRHCCDGADGDLQERRENHLNSSTFLQTRRCLAVHLLSLFFFFLHCFPTKLSLLPTPSFLPSPTCIPAVIVVRLLGVPHNFAHVGNSVQSKDTCQTSGHKSRRLPNRARSSQQGNFRASKMCRDMVEEQTQNGKLEENSGWP